ncbi:MAG: trypsin-like peptidase domain-containing protein [Acidobacteria bacterium]|nr:trypsin-like peptidase domain-containing protein [Acidobacteriota bacterium]
MTARMLALLTLTQLAAFHASAARVAPLREGVADIVERTLPSVVRVQVERKAASKAGAGEASGVIIAADGYILTNHHVVDGATAIRIQRSDETELPATLVSSDPQTDLAVLKVEAAGLPFLEFGDSSRLRVGDAVLAIGNPFGLGVTVTSGIVSARGRSTGLRQFEDFIQTDAAINPGNSGGALINRDGDLIGINTAILSPSGASNGIGFAIPANLARSVMSDLIVHGHVRRGYLGLGLQPMTADLAEALAIDAPNGALISDVTPDSPAAKAGVEKGSVLTAIDGLPIRSFDRLRLYIAEAKPGVTIQLKLATTSGERTLPVTLTERSQTAALTQEEQLPGGAIVSGLLMLAIDPEGQFAAAGLRPGDVISGVNRKPVASLADVKREVGQSQNRNVLIEVNRGGSSYFFAIARANF